MEGEIWKVIDDFENYMVSNQGRVKNCKRNKVLKPNKMPNDYYKIDLWKNRIAKACTIHRLVANAFITN